MKFVRIILSFIHSQIKLLLISGLLVIIFCELYMRFPYLPTRLEYQPDAELIAILRPSQVGYDWLGNMSYKSPKITLNSDGHRGKETDWSKPVILTLGNSEAFGAGVADHEVWTTSLESALQQEFGLSNLQVVNASHPGFGPYQHYILLKRILELHLVNAIIVRVDLADRYFKPYPSGVLIQKVYEARLRQKIRYYTKGIPYLANKTTAQLRSIRDSIKPSIFRKKQKMSNHSASTGRNMLRENSIWWEKIISLANRKKIPLILMVYDAFASEGCSIIFEGLKKLARGDGNTFILRLGPKAFGLNAWPRKILRKKFNATLTLKRDPHANALQQKLVASAVLRFFLETQLLRNIELKIKSEKL